MPPRPCPCTRHSRRISGDIDYLVCAGYKHLLCPRGVRSCMSASPPGTPSSLSRPTGVQATCRTAATSVGRSSSHPTRPASMSRSHGSAGSAPANRCGCWSNGRRRVLSSEVRAHAARLSEGLGVADAGTTLVCAPVADDAGAGPRPQTARTGLAHPCGARHCVCRRMSTTRRRTSSGRSRSSALRGPQLDAEHQQHRLRVSDRRAGWAPRMS